MSMQSGAIRLHGRIALPTVRAVEPRAQRWSLRTQHLLWVVAFVVGLIVFVSMPQRELPLYVLAGQRMSQGETIYRTDERAFTYPPLFALPFVPFTYLPEAAQRVVWYAINFAAMAIIVLRLKRRLVPILPATPRGWTGSPWLFWALVVLIAGRHVSAVLENQSHDLIVFLGAFLAIDALCSARPKVSGLWAGLATALKATPLLFAPIFLWQRRWAACACLALAIVAGTLLP
ncbi:MAG TPA: glycosyltransferase family 87 protein, partial [Gemmataceae bacterium]|nr:glycosyltransferase family 87 protein [Gemmataceae bacterium]